MNRTALHIFRNTPFGRETFIQSIFTCKNLGMSLSVYIPEQKQFMLYFDSGPFQVDLDSSYLISGHTARMHAEEILEKFQFKADFFTPKDYTASNLPDLPADFALMTSPRVISDLSSKIRLGHIGPKVRNILRHASFPVLIPSHVFKKWEQIKVFFGGSQNSVKALRLALRIARVSDKPLDLVTYSEENDKNFYRQIIEQEGLTSEVERQIRSWLFWEEGGLEENLYDIEHDSLVVLGAYGHGVIRDFVFGSKMETIQSELPNSMLICGPVSRMPSI